MIPTLRHLLPRLITRVVLLTGLAGLAGSCTQKPVVRQNQWQEEMQAFVRQDKRTPAPARPIVFTGSSSVRFWETLATDFPGQAVLNRGFGGSQLADVNKHFGQLIKAYKPRQVVVYSGDNDIAAGVAPQQVAQAFAQLAERLHRELPKTRLLYIAIKPSPSRIDLYPQMQDANRQISAYCRQQAAYCDFVDVGPAMLGADGQPRPELYREDGLHMTPAGYVLWRQLVAPHLVQ